MVSLIMLLVLVLFREFSIKLTKILFDCLPRANCFSNLQKFVLFTLIKSQSSEFKLNFKDVYRYLNPSSFKGVCHSTNFGIGVNNANLITTLNQYKKIPQHNRTYFFSLQQCDQLDRLFFNILPFVTMKMSPIMSKFCQSRLIILPNNQ